MDDPEPTALLKPPKWAIRLRRFLMRTYPLAIMGGFGCFVIGILTAGPWLPTVIFGILFVLSLPYALFALLLRLYLPLILQFTLGGMLITILTIGACVSALMSSSSWLQIGGVVALLIGLVVTAHYSTQHELRYKWTED